MQLNARRSRSAMAVSFALVIAFPVIGSAQQQQQQQQQQQTPPNTRAPADDPRVGLKPGLYDAVKRPSSGS